MDDVRMMNSVSFQLWSL